MLPRLLVLAIVVASFTPLSHTVADEAKPNVISGRVTLEGKPLAAGTIAFHGSDGQFFGCKIKGGNYRIDHARVGIMRVTITGADVPPPFSSADSTTLRAEVKEGESLMDFSLAF